VRSHHASFLFTEIEQLLCQRPKMNHKIFKLLFLMRF